MQIFDAEEHVEVRVVAEADAVAAAESGQPGHAALGAVHVPGSAALRIGEQAVVASACRYIIFRTAWLYSEYGRNFVKTMLALTAAHPVVKVVDDQVGTPTYGPDLARLIVDVIDGGKLDRTGIYNYTGEGVCSWYDFASEINSLAGHGCKVLPCSSSDYPTKARRPHYSVLDKSLVKTTFGISIPHWKEPLKACIQELTNEN